MKKILLVEDNEDNRDLVCALLDDQYLVEECKDAGEALQRLRKGHDDAQPDLLLLDISLPGMDGLELLHRIREDSQLAHIPAVALTAHAMKDDGDRFRAAGFEGYVTKPIVDETLLYDAIAGLLQRGNGKGP